MPFYDHHGNFFASLVIKFRPLPMGGCCGRLSLSAEERVCRQYYRLFFLAADVIQKSFQLGTAVFKLSIGRSVERGYQDLTLVCVNMKS